MCYVCISIMKRNVMVSPRPRSLLLSMKLTLPCASYSAIQMKFIQNYAVITVERREEEKNAQIHLKNRFFRSPQASRLIVTRRIGWIHPNQRGVTATWRIMSRKQINVLMQIRSSVRVNADGCGGVEVKRSPLTHSRHTRHFHEEATRSD